MVLSKPYLVVCLVLAVSLQVASAIAKCNLVRITSPFVVCPNRIREDGSKKVWPWRAGIQIDGPFQQLDTSSVGELYLEFIIPKSLQMGRNQCLKKLNLAANDLSGFIPSELGNCTLLEHLKLSNNFPSALSSNLILPQSMNSTRNSSDPSRCRWAGISCDRSGYVISIELPMLRISGSLGKEIGLLRRLKKLNLAANDLSGFIPSELGNCTLLEHLKLSNNLLSAAKQPLSGRNYLAVSLRTWKLFKFEEVGSYANNLSGSIPEFFVASNLLYLDLSFNKLNGQIPLTVGNIVNLTMINLCKRKNDDVPSLLEDDDVPSLHADSSFLLKKVIEATEDFNPQYEIAGTNSGVEGEVQDSYWHCLDYLHNDCRPTIIHRDIKPKIILLDADMEPHISDFGIAKLDQDSTQSAAIIGTLGYIAPEATYMTRTSKESDVYSYGVVLLELITRKMVIDPSFYENMGIVGWVTSTLDSTSKIEVVIDEDLANEVPGTSESKEVNKVLSLAMRCVAARKASMQPSMQNAVKELQDIKSRFSAGSQRQRISEPTTST
ncbi:hypothetical protein ZIOFF_021146 [Zingiber officinale]|uniref:Protein kinase domain-containing protein n=2 Tax=Zingiber officinale TaxID=94328 RepID=A0A8J5H3F4_ZINOF|nr:hypothetical protein ZIOFF_021146 [Zingiber officinale]